MSQALGKTASHSAYKAYLAYWLCNTDSPGLQPAQSAQLTLDLPAALNYILKMYLWKT